ncbi:MAG: 3-dehydroquinate synthase [Deltaproteobacteria bacterium]|nr:3-dehydroquinate synthase [Deltaproteobacteria bacterium]
MVKTRTIAGISGRSDIHVGESLDELRQYLPAGRRVAVITDTIVRDLYAKRFPQDAACITIGVGEEVKTMATVEHIFEQLIAMDADRSTFIVGIGGGIVCDIAGLAASLYLRGVDFGYVSTTLLAQVDASVGGKTGVNFGGYKNMVGVFNQPRFVICDTSLLGTLPAGEVSCGFAEIVKHGVIADADMFAYLERNSAGALALDDAVLQHLVVASVDIKAGVVGRDEKEKGERRILNFGHTFGHAIEKSTGLRHGEAVSLGMVIAAALSVERGLLSREDEARIVALLKSLQLPVKIEMDKDAVLDALMKDKKRQGDSIKFVLADGLGGALVQDVGYGELTRIVKRLD